MPTTPSVSSLRSSKNAASSPLRGSLKGSLAVVMLLMLALLLWQLVEQFQQTQERQRQRSIDYSVQLADRLSLNMALSAQIALNLLDESDAHPQTAEQKASLLATLRKALPALNSIAWTDANGAVQGDSAETTPDATYLAQALVENENLPYFYADAPDGIPLYLFIRQPVGDSHSYWVLRLSPQLFKALTPSSTQDVHPLWQLENAASQRVIYRNGIDEAAPQKNSANIETVIVAPLTNSHWQLRGLYDAEQARQGLIAPLIGKCLIALACSIVPLLALFSLRRRQRQLHESRRRYKDIFEGTGVALCVLDLSDLPEYLSRLQLQTRQALSDRLERHPAQLHGLLQRLRITEVNQVAASLLESETAEQVWRQLIEGCPRTGEGIGLLLLQAVVEGSRQLEMELRLPDALGNDRYLWLSVTLPERSDDFNAVILSINDITRRKQLDLAQLRASESLRDSEQRYRMLAESISDVIFSTDRALKPNYVSPSVNAALGYSAEWILKNGWTSTVANPQQLARLYGLVSRVAKALPDPQALAALQAQIPTQLFLFDCLRADGRKIPVELRLVLVWGNDGAFEGILGVGRDVSQQRRAEKDLRMAATVFEHSTSAILITDPAGYIVQANDAFSRVSGYTLAQVLDQLPMMLAVDDQQEAHLSYILNQLNQRGSWEGEVWLKRRNGEHYPAWVGITAVLDDEGDLASYVCFFTDISERKASEQRIHRLAYYDALTHLPNRTLFQDRLHTALQQAERQNAWVVLMFLDLDRFKPINDSLGHAAGDRMLKDMAGRLLECVADDDTVARMGGDEFTLLLQPGATQQVALNRAIHVAEQILASLVRPFVLEGREFFVTASIGIALSPQDGNELSQLMKNADTAMYHAKERGKNNFQFYQADMNASALERLELESDLRHALEQEEFTLYYQPQFSGDGKRLTGAEALLRWRHPRRGLVPPSDFIPVLEELGLVVEVGDWVITEACRQLKAWHKAKVRVPKMSVNISARQFADGTLGTRIATILNETELPPACLELELTESILMSEVNVAMLILAGLKRLGLSIAVDDFGTGYSSLNYLKQFPIDVLKIDRTFVDGLPSGEQDAQIARAIIAMAHSLNLSVIAEGVETHEQLEFLREHGCDEVQGYLFGRPMTPERFEAQFSNDALFMLD